MWAPAAEPTLDPRLVGESPCTEVSGQWALKPSSWALVPGGDKGHVTVGRGGEAQAYQKAEVDEGVGRGRKGSPGCTNNLGQLWGR